MAFGGKKKSTETEVTVDVKASRSDIVTIPGINIDSIRTLVIGTAPLVTHQFSAKAREMMKSKQMGVAQGARNNVSLAWVVRKALSEYLDRDIHLLRTGN